MFIYKIMPDGERGFAYEPSPIIKHAAGSPDTEFIYKSRTPRQTLKAVYTRQASRSPATVSEIVESLEEKGMFGAGAGISARLAAAKPKLRGGGGSKRLMGLERQEKPITARLAARGTSNSEVDKAWSPQAREAAAMARKNKGGGATAKPGLMGRIKAGIKEQFRTQSNQEIDAEETGNKLRVVGGVLGGKPGAAVGERIGQKVGAFTGKIKDKFEYPKGNVPPMPKQPKMQS